MNMNVNIDLTAAEKCEAMTRKLNDTEDTIVIARGLARALDNMLLPLTENERPSVENWMELEHQSEPIAAMLMVLLEKIEEAIDIIQGA